MMPLSKPFTTSAITLTPSPLSNHLVSLSVATSMVSLPVYSRHLRFPRVGFPGKVSYQGHDHLRSHSHKLRNLLYHPPLALVPLGRSNHIPVFLKSKDPRCIPPPTFTKKRCRCIPPAAKGSFLSAISSVDWLAEVNSASSPDAATDALHLHLLSIFERSFCLGQCALRHTPHPQMAIDNRDHAFKEGKHRKYIRLKEQVIS